MRDDRHKWPPTPDAKLPNRVRDRLSVLALPTLRQTVISGDIADCLAASGSTRAIGCGPDRAQGETYCLRQRRDRVLVINGPEITDGWHPEANVAVSDMSSAYVVVELAGVGVEQLIATGTEFALDRPSASTSRLWHGFGILLYRYGADDQFRMHVRTPLFEPLWDMIERQSSLLSNLWVNESAAGGLSNDEKCSSLHRTEARG